MTRIGTFVQIEPKVDRDAELFGMPDENGGIYLAVWKQPSIGIDEKADVMLHLNRKQLVLLEMLLDHAYKQGPLIPKSAPHEDEEAQPDREEPVDVLNVETGETEENKA